MNEWEDWALVGFIVVCLLLLVFAILAVIFGWGGDADCMNYGKVLICES